MNHPDEAFSFTALGSLFFQQFTQEYLKYESSTSPASSDIDKINRNVKRMEDLEYAFRCYLHARYIREQTLGGDTVDTAFVYNNLGCCYFVLGKQEESVAYFELAHAII